MGYAAVRGGLDAIEAAENLVRRARLDGPGDLLSLDTILQRLRLLDTIPFTFDRPTPLEGLAEAPGPSTSRDGRPIHLTSDGDGRVGLSFTAASGATTTTLVDLRGPRDYELRWATWSPDDRWILFGDSRGRLMIVNSDGRDGPRLLAETGGRWWKTTASWLMPDIAPGSVDLSSLPNAGRRLR
ncbi:MAG: hypothetical protein ACI867_000709 [Glaciecola sp.]|jgi:hypothetical protein